LTRINFSNSWSRLSDWKHLTWKNREIQSLTTQLIKDEIGRRKNSITQKYSKPKIESNHKFSIKRWNWKRKITLTKEQKNQTKLKNNNNILYICFGGWNWRPIKITQKRLEKNQKSKEWDQSGKTTHDKMGLNNEIKK
jgi:hypothetical protein